MKTLGFGFWVVGWGYETWVGYERIELRRPMKKKLENSIFKRELNFKSLLPLKKAYDNRRKEGKA